MLAGTNGAGDSFRYTKAFSIDTVPPQLMLSSPVNGSFFNSDNTLSVTGLFEPDARLSVNMDGVDIVNGKTLQELGAVMDQNGVWSFTLGLGEGMARHSLIFIAQDAAANLSTRQLKVQHGGLGRVTGYEIVYRPVSGGAYRALEGNNLSLNETGDTNVILAVRAKTSNGEAIILNDPALVLWDVQSAQGSITLDEDGLLRAAKGSIGAVFARLPVTGSLMRTVAATIGAEAYGEKPKEDAPANSGGGSSAADGRSYVPLKRCALIYDANGGEGVMLDVFSPYVQYASVTVMENAYTRDGYALRGFNTQKDGGGTAYQSGDTFVITKDTVLYAQWEAAKKNSGAVQSTTANAEGGLDAGAGAGAEVTQGAQAVQSARTGSKAANASTMAVKAALEAIPAPKATKSALYLLLAPVSGGALYLVLLLLKRRYF